MKKQILNLMQSVFGLKSSNLRPERTSNGYKIYYDKTSGKAVGIVCKNLVFLKDVSEKTMTWNEAVEYCQGIIINGITAELCPVKPNRTHEFEGHYPDLGEALKEIGAPKNDWTDCTWCSEYTRNHAWGQNLKDGSVLYYYKDSSNLVRPVLVLNR